MSWLLLVIAAGVWALVLGLDTLVGIVFWGAVVYAIGRLLDREIPGLDQPQQPQTEEPHDPETPESLAEWTRRHTVRLPGAWKGWIYDLKRRPCERCGRSFSPRKMTFHHREPEQRAFTIGIGQGRSLEELADEIDKCDVLCRWCHTEEHRSTSPKENPAA